MRVLHLHYLVLFSKHPILKTIECFEQMFPISIFCFKTFLKFFGQVYYYYPSPSSKMKILFKVNKKLQRSTILVCIAQKFKALPEMTFCYLSVQTFSMLCVCVCVCMFQSRMVPCLWFFKSVHI